VGGKNRNFIFFGLPGRLLLPPLIFMGRRAKEYGHDRACDAEALCEPYLQITAAFLLF
jgi:hypothetical protein